MPAIKLFGRWVQVPLLLVGQPGWGGPDLLIRGKTKTGESPTDVMVLSRDEARQLRDQLDAAINAGQPPLPALAITGWRQWGDDDDSIDVRLATAGDGLVDSVAAAIAAENGLERFDEDEDESEFIYCDGVTISNGQEFRYDGATYRVRIERV